MTIYSVAQMNMMFEKLDQVKAELAEAREEAEQATKHALALLDDKLEGVTVLQDISCPPPPAYEDAHYSRPIYVVAGGDAYPGHYNYGYHVYEDMVDDSDLLAETDDVDGWVYVPSYRTDDGKHSTISLM